MIICSSSFPAIGDNAKRYHLSEGELTMTFKRQSPIYRSMLFIGAPLLFISTICNVQSGPTIDSISSTPSISNAESDKNVTGIADRVRIPSGSVSPEALDIAQTNIQREAAPPATGELTRLQVRKPASRALTASVPVTMREIIPNGFRDDDDYSSLPYILTPSQLTTLGLKREIQRIPEFDRPLMLQRKRESPILEVRIHAILTSNSDGSDPAKITPAQIKQLVDQTNLVWWRSGIEFLFDPNTDIESRKDTLLHLRFPLDEYEKNKTNPDWEPGSVDVSSTHYARTAVGLAVRKKIVVFFSDSFGFKWDEVAKEWYRQPAGGYSGHDLEYVFMPNYMPEKNLLAHELGHYLHLPHPFVSGIETVQEASAAIKDWVENQGHAPKQGALVFDGDNRVRFPTSPVDIKDTPPDPDGQIFNRVYGAGAKCMTEYGTVDVPVFFANGKQKTYELTPDRLNVMSYYKGCHDLGIHHVTDGQIAASRNALLNGNRLHLLTPGIDRANVRDLRRAQ